MARDFNGTTSYVSLNDSSSLRTPTTAITVCVWHRIDVSLGGASASIVHKIANGGLDPYLSYAIKQLSVATGIFRAGISTSGSGSLVLTADTTALTDRLWYAFVLRWAQGGAVTLSVYNADKTLNQTVASASSSITIGYSSNPLRIMRNEGTNSLGGQASNVIVDNIKWTDSQVSSWLATGRPHKAVALNMPLLGIPVEPDYSGNANTGSTGTTSYADNPPIWTGLAGTGPHQAVAATPGAFKAFWAAKRSHMIGNR